MERPWWQRLLRKTTPVQLPQTDRPLFEFDDRGAPGERRARCLVSPDHVLLRATYEDAGTGLLDIARLAAALKRIKNRIVTRRLERVSPLAVPALLEISKEMVAGEAHEDILREAEESLIEEAMRVD